jgi:hypothetical protein
MAASSSSLSLGGIPQRSDSVNASAPSASTRRSEPHGRVSAPRARALPPTQRRPFPG